MRLLRSLDEIKAAAHGAVVSVGNFDGVHRGHRQIVSALQAMAARLGVPAWVFTFDPHPLTLLRPEQVPPPLMWVERKAEVLAGLGVDALLAYPTSWDILRLDYRSFFDQILRDQLNTRGLVEGENFFFGKDRQGNVDRLRDLCQTAGLPLEIVTLLDQDDDAVSSTRIRQWIANGELHEANQALTEPYQIRGTVVPGDQRGRTLGFPTANLEGCDVLLPAAGVYAGASRVDGRLWPAAVHLGPLPTFQQTQPKIEVHLLGFSGDLYGQALQVALFDRIRDVRAFQSAEDLKQQLQRDLAETRSRFAETTGSNGNPARS